MMNSGAFNLLHLHNNTRPTAQQQQQSILGTANTAGVVMPMTVDFGKFMVFAQPTATGAHSLLQQQPQHQHRSPSPECPSFEHMERKQKKPLMEKKRRARINACFDQLKEMLLHSELQQNSKLEKADILEKSVFYMRLMQQQIARLQQQLQQMLSCTESGVAFQRGVREGVSLAVTATVDLLAGLPPPLCSPELCQRVRTDVPDKVAQMATIAVAGLPPPPSTQQQQQHNQSAPQLANAIPSPSSAIILPQQHQHSVPLARHLDGASVSPTVSTPTNLLAAPTPVLRSSIPIPVNATAFSPSPTQIGTFSANAAALFRQPFSNHFVNLCWPFVQQQTQKAVNSWTTTTTMAQQQKQGGEMVGPTIDGNNTGNGGAHCALQKEDTNAEKVLDSKNDNCCTVPAGLSAEEPDELVDVEGLTNNSNGYGIGDTGTEEVASEERDSGVFSEESTEPVVAPTTTTKALAGTADLLVMKRKKPTTTTNRQQNNSKSSRVWKPYALPGQH